MKLTELRNKINEALKIHDDYDVKIAAEDFMDTHLLDLEDADIDCGRFNFNIYTDITDVLHYEGDEP